MKYILMLILPLISNVTFAHSGHQTDESIHNLFHIEHIIMLTVIAGIAYIIKKKTNS